jgi:hypothetical protein
MNGRGDDPDEYRNAMVTDDMPPPGWTRGLEIALPQRNRRTEAEAERDVLRLRKDADDLVAELRDLVPALEPPTLPDDPEALERVIVRLRQQIKVASVPQQHNGWLGHRFEARAPGSPRVCAVCNKTIADASGRCRGRPGRY